MKATDKSTSRRAARTPAVVDPIFAAIEGHRTAREWIRALEADHSAVGADAAFSALISAASARLSALLTMTPTTLAGCAAMLRYVEAYTVREDDTYSQLFSDWFEPVSGPAATLLGRLAAVIEPAA